MGLFQRLSVWEGGGTGPLPGRVYNIYRHTDERNMDGKEGVITTVASSGLCSISLKRRILYVLSVFLCLSVVLV